MIIVYSNCQNAVKKYYKRTLIKKINQKIGFMKIQTFKIQTIIILFAINLLCFSNLIANVKDIDENEYKTKKIGKQEWIVENLKVKKFRNGDAILEAKNEKEWLKAIKDKKPAFRYLFDKVASGYTFGLMYNYYAINDKRGLAPNGFRIPNSDDWSNLESAVEVFMESEGDEEKMRDDNATKKQLKSIEGWSYSHYGTGNEEENEDGTWREETGSYECYNGNNMSGFNGLPAGSLEKNNKGKLFFDFKNSCKFWTIPNLVYDLSQLNLIDLDKEYLEYKEDNYLYSGYYVRCIK